MSSAVKIGRVQADGLNIFYRYAGAESAPIIVPIHGFPSSSHQYRNLIPLLAKQYRVVAPDLPGFGFTEVPAERKYKYTFENLATTFAAFVDALKLQRFAIYIFDYGAPTGLRFALDHPDRIAAIVTQNGNAYVEGLGRPFWDDIETLWTQAGDTPENRDKLRHFFTLGLTKFQYTHGAPDADAVPPEAYWLDQALLDRPGNQEIQLDLFQNYGTNVALYPRFHEYFRASGVPVLAVWGKGDPIFVPPGAEAFRKDVEKFELHFLDGPHFALETNEEAMAKYITAFLEKFRVFKA
jgi:pimeloyl-ACP methyl ester carboxylesterase